MISLSVVSRATYQCVHFATTDEIRVEHGETEPNGTGVVLAVALTPTTDKEELLRLIATAFRFPDYFRANWDSTEECLRDLEWMPAKGYALRLRNAEHLWSTIPREAGRLIEVWLSAAEYWAANGVAFHLIFEW